MFGGIHTVNSSGAVRVVRNAIHLCLNFLSKQWSVDCEVRDVVCHLTWTLEDGVPWKVMWERDAYQQTALHPRAIEKSAVSMDTTARFVLMLGIR